MISPDNHDFRESRLTHSPYTFTSNTLWCTLTIHPPLNMVLNHSPYILTSSTLWCTLTIRPPLNMVLNHSPYILTSTTLWCTLTIHPPLNMVLNHSPYILTSTTLWCSNTLHTLSSPIYCLYFSLFSFVTSHPGGVELRSFRADTFTPSRISSRSLTP